MMISGWGKLHASYQDQHWVEKPSIFAEAAIKYFPQTGRLLELGAGHGQDSFFFAGQGYDVLSSDIEVSSLKLNHAKQPETIRKKIEVLQLDLNHALPFEEESLDIVYAHMSLHYFDRATTDAIFRELGRVLKKGGVLAFLANSISDPEYSTGSKIEDDFFLMNAVSKRFFSKETAKDFARDFQVVLLDDLGRTYKDEAKGVSNLIQFIGRK